MRRIGRPVVLFAICCIAIPVSARVPGQLGKVNFPTSCAPEAQATLEKGLALLHSFQYLESEQTFTEVTKQDPQCAMARWGKAMALYHQLWDFPQASTLKKGLEESSKRKKAAPSPIASALTLPPRLPSIRTIQNSRTPNAHRPILRRLPNSTSISLATMRPRLFMPSRS